MQHQYWVTKETVFRKLGKKEDENIVASDAELDAKLELFKSIQESCLELQRIIDKYQERICLLAQEENSLGRFLKESGKHDKTGAGHVMTTLGKTMSHLGQHRISLRNPLLRLFQEVETFRHRAIEDTGRTVGSMEKSRTEYRACLNWMKDVSQELDPDTYKQLEKFRKVQEKVKNSKAVFDRYKLDCLQKVDLLAAARCNMFSHALILYHNVMLQFATSASQALHSIATSCKDHKKYEFNVVRELSEMKPENDSNNSVSESQQREQQQEQQETLDKLLDFEEDPVESSASADTQPTELNDPTISMDFLADVSETAASNPSNPQSFLPSQLLMQSNLINDCSSLESFGKQFPGSFASSLAQPPTSSLAPHNVISDLQPLHQSTNDNSAKSWLDLFSELDPLSNPDNIASSSSEPLRNC